LYERTLDKDYDRIIYSWWKYRRIGKTTIWIPTPNDCKNWNVQEMLHLKC